MFLADGSPAYPVRFITLDDDGGRWLLPFWYLPRQALEDESGSAVRTGARGAFDRALVAWAKTDKGREWLSAWGKNATYYHAYMGLSCDEQHLRDEGIVEAIKLRELTHTSRCPQVTLSTGLHELLARHGIDLAEASSPHRPPASTSTAPAAVRTSSTKTLTGRSAAGLAALALVMLFSGLILLAVSMLGHAHLPFFGNNWTTVGLCVPAVIVMGALADTQRVGGRIKRMAYAGALISILGLIIANGVAPLPRQEIAAPDFGPHLLYYQCGDGSHRTEMSSCPLYSGPAPQRVGATCRDGWESSATGSGACSWHGGVAHWQYDGPYPKFYGIPSPVYSSP
jgi:hypothetical protein